MQRSGLCMCVGRTGGQFSATNYSSLLRQLHNFHAVALFLLFLFCLLFRCAWSRTEYRQSSWPLWSLHELEQRVALIAYSRAIFARFALPHTHTDLLFVHFRFAFGAVNSFDTAHGIHITQYTALPSVVGRRTRTRSTRDCIADKLEKVNMKRYFSTIYK